MKNKGFSLVELIVVIAIMAVLVGFIAPQLSHYINRTRISTDIDTGSEIAKAVMAVVTSEGISENAKEHSDPFPVYNMDGNDFREAVVKQLSLNDITDIKAKSKKDYSGAVIENGQPQFYYTLDAIKNKVEVYMGGTTADYQIYPSLGSKFVE